MPWVFLPDVVFKNYEEYDLLARLFRIGEVSVDKVFTERVLLKKKGFWTMMVSFQELNMKSF